MSVMAMMLCIGLLYPYIFVGVFDDFSYNKSFDDVALFERI